MVAYCSAGGDFSPQGAEQIEHIGLFAIDTKAMLFKLN